MRCNRRKVSSPTAADVTGVDLLVVILDTAGRRTKLRMEQAFPVKNQVISKAFTTIHNSGLYESN